MKRILVLEDDLGTLNSFDRMLRGEGYKVSLVSRADAALRHLEKQATDVVILDLELPGISGLSALGEMNNLYPTLPVIVVTGKPELLGPEEARQRGAFDWFAKPFAPADVLDSIRRAEATNA